MLSSVARFRWAGGVAGCATAAVVAVLLARGSSLGSLVPLLFLAVLLPCARYFGALAGVVGSLVSALIFAIFLYQPIGSIEIVNQSARTNLGLMLLGGIVISYFIAAEMQVKH